MFLEHFHGLARFQPDAPLYTWLKPSSRPLSFSVTRTLSYSNVDVITRKLAHHLLYRCKLAPGSTVLLCYPPDSFDFLLAFLACLTARLIPVPTFPPDPTRIRATLPSFIRIANLTKPSAVLSTKKYKVVLSIAQSLVLSRDAPPPNLRWIVTDHITRKVPSHAPEFDLSRSENEIAYVQWTSGTTKTPRCVKVSYGSLWSSCFGMTEHMRMPPIHPVLPGVLPPQSQEIPFIMVSWLPFYHDLGLVHSALLPIYRGGSAVFFSPLDFLAEPALWPIVLSEFQGTVTGGPTFALHLVARRWKALQQQSKDLPDLNLSHIWNITLGAEPIRLGALKMWNEVFQPYGFRLEQFVPAYGSAEATVAIARGQSASHIDEFVTRRIGCTSENEDAAIVSCGSDFEQAGVHIAVLRLPRLYDKEDIMEEAKEGEVGEVIFTGNVITSGYWHENPSTNTDHIHMGDQNPWVPLECLPTSIQSQAKAYPDIYADVWFRTGDLGVIENGHLFITGRVAEAIPVDTFGSVISANDIEYIIGTDVALTRPGSIVAVSISGAGHVGSGIPVQILCELKCEVKDGQAIRDILLEVRAKVYSEFGLRAGVTLVKKGALPKTTSGKLQRLKAAEAWKRGELQKATIGTLPL
ncbi:hypothetical protein F5884DRAFT_780547 [Xylogone sp. PMI_703]|nr:hypothetical protein F5884DRAFT_780547 [Xylogone sp. PMI_703]